MTESGNAVPSLRFAILQELLQGSKLSFFQGAQFHLYKLPKGVVYTVYNPVHLWAPCRYLREPQANSREPLAPSHPIISSHLLYF